MPEAATESRLNLKSIESDPIDSKLRYVPLSRAYRETESRFVLAVKRGKLNIKLKIGGNIMAAITFDTLKYANRLKAAGVPDKQAEAEAEVLSEALEVNLKELITKEDLHREMESLRRDIDARFVQVDLHFVQLEQRLIIKLGGLMALSIGIVAALVKLL